jgi:site-specific recombinase XerD
LDLLQKAWSRETFRKYRRTLTRLQDWLCHSHTTEDQILDRNSANFVVANFITSLGDTLSDTVKASMLSHLRRILLLLHSETTQGVLATLAQALSRSTPTTSRRYDTIWDIDQLLNWIRAWKDNESLSLEELRTKTMLLIMIFSACRLAELGRMRRPTVPGGTFTSLALPTILKQKQAEKTQIVIRRVSQPNLCPVAAVLAWLQRSPDAPDGFLFHCLTRIGSGDCVTLHRVMSTADIAPELVGALRAAGIEHPYTAYSVKHAVVTKLYLLGATDEQVVAYGHWARGSLTPRKWYNIATLESEWLGTKLLKETMDIKKPETEEKFAESYLAPTRTEEQAAARADTCEALITPMSTLEQCAKVSSAPA